VEALGSYNGSVVVTDPETGRILTVVNQKMAFQSGFTPCSTIKLVTALAALNEGLVERSTLLRLGRRYTLDLTQALARSDNPYFMRLGNKLGFERVTQYARLFGLGEKAGLGIEGEEPGVLPLVPPEYGGVGIMTAFGLGISLTPLELSALLSALANGGTLYYLQYPKSQEEAADFVPKVKRELDLGTEISDVKVGMRAAVEAGTARRADDPTQPVLGKTGTCTDFRARAHLGWFGSFNDVGRNKLVVVVLLTGGRSVSGPVAAGVAGAFYRQLSEQQYFASTSGVTPADLIATQACCAR
jgi:cell division protein FtsI/penicillin-binding protein 2